MATSTATNKSIAPTSVLTAAVALGTTAGGSFATDTPSGAVLICTAGSEGARIPRVDLSLRDTVVASRVVLLRGNDASGTTKRHIRSRAITAVTWSTTVEPTAIDFGYTESSPLFLGPNESLWALQTVAQTTSAIIVNAEGGRYTAP